MTFVELSGNKGWIVESASERKVLEKSAGGQFMVEHITGCDHPKTPKHFRQCPINHFNTANVIPC